MRIAIGALLFEGNTLSPVVNELIDFQNKYCEDGPRLVAKLRGQGVEMSGAIAVLEAEGVEIVPLFASHGGAGGRAGELIRRAAPPSPLRKGLTACRGAGG